MSESFLRDLAIAIGALGTFIAVVSTPVIQLFTYFDNRAEKRLAAQERINAARREQKLDKVAASVEKISGSGG